MAKKASGGSPAWMATFADLMSLLMALFVLLYAMSSPEAAKYKAAVESLTEALGNGSELTPEQLEFFRSVPDEIPTESIEPPKKEGLSDSEKEAMRMLYEQLEKSFSHSTGEGNIEIAYDDESNQIQLVFPEQIAFDQGSADLKARFRVILRKFYQFRKESVAIQVVGHTDSIPISGGRFRSNWELSSARAAGVITQLIEDGSVRPDQVQAIGLADTQPIEKGDTAEAHAKNRRVEILITREEDRPVSKVDVNKNAPETNTGGNMDELNSKVEVNVRSQVDFEEADSQ